MGAGNDSNNPDENVDLPRAILTSDDRLVLTGQKEFTQIQQRRNARYRIRERIKSGIHDLGFLYQNLSDEDLGQVFSDLMDNDREKLVRACSFIFRGVDFVQSQDNDTTIEEFEEFLEQSIHRAVLWKYDNRIFTIDVDINVNKRSGDFDKVRDRLLHGNGTYRDLEYLIKNDEMVPLIREMGGGQTITVSTHFDKDEESEKFTLDDLVSLGLNGVRERLTG